MVIVFRDGRTVIDSNFSFDERDDEGELRYGKINPVRILNDYWGLFQSTLKARVRQVWLDDWVLDCGTGEIVLRTDMVARDVHYREVYKAMGNLVKAGK